MTLIRSTAAGLALAALVGGAAMAGGDKTKTSTMGADTGRASDAAATSKMNWTQAEKDKMKACKAMSAQAMAADAECVRLKNAHAAHKAGSSGAATATPR